MLQCLTRSLAEESAVALFSRLNPFHDSLICLLEGTLDPLAERRKCVRKKVHAPAFASFDGVSGGMILDLSEEGLSMQLDGEIPGIHSRVKSAAGSTSVVPVELDLGTDSTAASFKPQTNKLQTTGYIAWADALGRAGVRFSELPQDARSRITDWLAANASTPSSTAPKLALHWPRHNPVKADAKDNPFAISIEATSPAEGDNGSHRSSATVQYEFHSLGQDLSAILRLVTDRARVLTRGTSSAIALLQNEDVICRASIGRQAPALGAKLDVNAGLSGECFREGFSLRCDDTECDNRVDLESSRRFGVRSMVAAPLRFERSTIGLLVVFSDQPFNFDEGDVGIVNSLAHTLVRSIRATESQTKTSSAH